MQNHPRLRNRVRIRTKGVLSLLFLAAMTASSGCASTDPCASNPEASVELDACTTSGNPRVNGGKCTAMGGSPDELTCLCPAGFSGPKCTNDVDECATNNGQYASLAQCTNTTASHACTCNSVVGCRAGTPINDCTAFTGGLCNAGTYAPSACVDGCIDNMAGEECEPPTSTTCDAMCKSIMSVICGNSVRELTEQCEDGNTTNLDGCDAACKFEQIHRVHWLAMQYGTDTYCTANQLGGAIASVA